MIKTFFSRKASANIKCNPARFLNNSAVPSPVAGDRATYRVVFGSAITCTTSDTGTTGNGARLHTSERRKSKRRLPVSIPAILHLGFCSSKATVLTTYDAAKEIRFGAPFLSWHPTLRKSPNEANSGRFPDWPTLARLQWGHRKTSCTKMTTVSQEFACEKGALHAPGCVQTRVNELITLAGLYRHVNRIRCDDLF